MKTRQRMIWPVILFVALTTVCFINVSSEKVNAQESIDIRVAFTPPAKHPVVVATEYFGKLLAEQTKNRVKVRVFPDGQLGGQREYPEMMRTGMLEMAEIMCPIAGNYDEKWQLFDLPFLFRDMDHYMKVIRGPVMQKIKEGFEKKTGIKILGIYIMGPRSIYNSKRPIYTAADLKGLKFRIVESEAQSFVWKSFGMLPVPIAAAGERYMALKTGIVDGAENSLDMIVSGKHYEVTKYISLTEHYLLPELLCISSKYYNSLPKDIQQAIDIAAEKAAEYEQKLILSQEIEMRKKLTDLGMKINEVKDKETFRIMARPIYEKLGKGLEEELKNVINIK